MVRTLAIMGLLISTSLSGATVPDIDDAIRLINHSVGVNEARHIALAIYKYSVANGLDPKLVAAVIAQESKFDHLAIGGAGEIGLMQLRPEFHAKHVKSLIRRQKYLIDIDHNVATGSRFLGHLRGIFEAQFSNFKYLEFYNRGANVGKVETFPYTTKVLKYYKLFGGVI